MKKEAEAQAPTGAEDSLTAALVAEYDRQNDAGDDDEQATAQASAEDGDAEADDSADDAPDDAADDDAEASADDTADDDEDSDAPGDDEDGGPGEATEPPSHWSEGDKAAFKSLPKAGQEFLLRRHKEMEADYTRKTTEVAPLRKALDPFRPEMERRGLSEAQAMQHITTSAQQLWQYQQAFNQNPKAALDAFAKQYGIDIGGGKTHDDPLADPELTELKETVTGLKRQLTEREQAEENARAESLQRQIQDFAADHPYFDDLRVTMGALMQAGRAKDMTEAYEQAQWSHPEIREKILAEQRSKQQATEAERRKKKVKDARKNGAAVRTTSTRRVAAPETTSIGDELRAQFDKAN